MFKKILVPLDGSSWSEAVLPQVRALAREQQAEVDLLRVSTAALHVYSEVPFNYAELIERDIADCKRYVEAIAEDLRKDGLTVATSVVDGYVAEAILDFADQNKVDLIAMSTHGRSGVRRMLLGSTADRVVHGAHMPILLVRPEDAKP
jgi:nucleotide-binding universal stress UspA family protein